jgi:HSP20 family protein
MNLISRNFYLDDIFEDFISPFKETQMKCDIYEKDGDYHIEIDIPGFEKKDINLEVKDGYLIISAEKQDKVKDEGKDYIRRERKYGKYQRSFYIGDVESEKIEAEFKDGLLKILVPKIEEVIDKKVIEIK